MVLIPPSSLLPKFSAERIERCRCSHTPSYSWNRSQCHRYVSNWQKPVFGQHQLHVKNSSPCSAVSLLLQQEHKHWGWLSWQRPAMEITLTRYLLGPSVPHWIPASPNYHNFHALWLTASTPCVIFSCFSTLGVPQLPSEGGSRWRMVKPHLWWLTCQRFLCHGSRAEGYGHLHVFGWWCRLR